MSGDSWALRQASVRVSYTEDLEEWPWAGSAPTETTTENKQPKGEHGE